MKKLKHGVAFLALVGIGFVSCEKEEVITEADLEKEQVINLRSSSNTQMAYVGSNGIVYLLNDEQEIPALEAIIAQEEQDILNGIIGRPKYPYQSEDCTLSNGARGLKCKPQKKGDCTSEFECIISHGGGAS